MENNSNKRIMPRKETYSTPKPTLSMKFCCTISLSLSQPLMFLQMVLVSSILLQLVQVSSFGNEMDRLALLHFKESVTNDSVGILNSWNDSIPHCNWFGVTCNIRHQRVASLSLEGHQLLGSVSPQIGNLSFLKYLNLRNNSFKGAIPQEVGKLFRLQVLILANNTLVGEIPVNLTSCSVLETVNVQVNNLSGNIPPQLGSLVKLQLLLLGANSLTGMIPSSLGNLSLLQQFTVGGNGLVGEIPGEMSRLNNLNLFFVGVNNLSGVIPPFLFNISSIEKLSFTANKFHGGIPEIGINLPNLRAAYFALNQLSGKIPSSLINASQLQALELSDNNFVGAVPSNMGDLSSLRNFRIGRNDLGTNSSNDLDFLASLASCRNLEILDIDSNYLGGVLPDAIANFSTRFSWLSVGGNQIFGKIPPAMENLTSLAVLGLENNLLTGLFPSYIGKFQKLQALSADRNLFSGRIPSSIANLSQLSVLSLSFNHLEGSIPSSIGKSQNHNYFALDSNDLTGKIPDEILNIPSLSMYLGISSNHISGSLPQTIGKLTEINTLHISDNMLSGEIPATIGNCLSLEQLYMQGNMFQGKIPEAMASLKGLQTLDLSQNNLTGNIPRELQNLTYLQYLNISFNDLEGEVPVGGVFGNVSAIFLAGNGRLCGGIPELHLPKCPTATQKKGYATNLKLPIIIGCLLLFVVLIVVLLVLFWKKQSRSKPSSPTLGPEPHLTVSYKSLHDATEGFSSQNLLGCGSFGFVYKGLLDQLERPVAIKVLNLQRQGASKSIVAECNALRNIRHRNLNKLITYCSSLDYKGNDFKALVFDFMPNGSLENWLHPESNQPRRLDILQRLNIVIDVASALHYLHDLCEVPIIHRDLKPSNVLLDDDMVAHVGDFGLAKFLSTTQSSVHTQTESYGIQGTTGYAAPEYGLGAAASKEADIYSYGILLLEMFTGRRPTDDIFTDGLNLVGFTKAALPERVMQVADPVLSLANVNETEATSSSSILAREEEEADQEIEQVRYGTEADQEIEQVGYGTALNMKRRPHYDLSALASVLEIGVSCSEESPNQRANLGDVLKKLHRVKTTLLSVQ